MLEKQYLRLTSAPDPETVRPEPVLELALDRLVKLLRSGDINYFYACDQFKVGWQKTLALSCNNNCLWEQCSAARIQAVEVLANSML